MAGCLILNCLRITPFHHLNPKCPSWWIVYGWSHSLLNHVLEQTLCQVQDGSQSPGQWSNNPSVSHTVSLMNDYCNISLVPIMVRACNITLVLKMIRGCNISLVPKMVWGRWVKKIWTYSCTPHLGLLQYMYSLKAILKLTQKYSFSKHVTNDKAQMIIYSLG